MKVLNLGVGLMLAAGAAADSHSYTPTNDVSAHSRMGLDVMDIQGMIADSTESMKIYTEGKNREGKSLQGMAKKDWAGAGADDAILKAYQTAVGEGASFLDQYNIDSIGCSGTFAGKSDTTCQISAKKNLMCTMLQYAQYEGEKAIAFDASMNWDEMYAFWHGTYDGGEMDGKGGPAQVQASRDADFGTDYRGAAMHAIVDGGAAVTASPVDKQGVKDAFAAFNKANAATFAQATLKYSYKAGTATEQADIDKSWGEGYTYFRCGAGLLEPGLASMINKAFDPRDADMSKKPEDLFCTILKEMAKMDDIGQGLTLKDLSTATYIPSASSDCMVDEELIGTAGSGSASDSSDSGDSAPAPATDSSDSGDSPAPAASDSSDSGDSASPASDDSGASATGMATVTALGIFAAVWA